MTTTNEWMNEWMTMHMKHFPYITNQHTWRPMTFSFSKKKQKQKSINIVTWLIQVYHIEDWDKKNKFNFFNWNLKKKSNKTNKLCFFFYHPFGFIVVNFSFFPFFLPKKNETYTKNVFRVYHHLFFIIILRMFIFKEYNWSK